MSRSATLGRRGQHLLRKLRDALDAMPDKRLIAGSIQDAAGQVCALGALDPKAPAYDDMEDELHRQQLAKHFDIAPALAAEIVYMNDDYWMQFETPELRWTRMRAWVQSQLVGDTTKPPDLGAARPCKSIFLLAWGGLTCGFGGLT